MIQTSFSFIKIIVKIEALATESASDTTLKDLNFKNVNETHEMKDL